MPQAEVKNNFLFHKRKHHIFNVPSGGICCMTSSRTRQNSSPFGFSESSSIPRSGDRLRLQIQVHKPIIYSDATYEQYIYIYMYIYISNRTRVRRVVMNIIKSFAQIASKTNQLSTFTFNCKLRSELIHNNDVPGEF